MGEEDAIRDGLLKPTVVAERLGISLPHLYQLARTGQIESVKFAKAVRFDPAVIERFIEAHRRPAANE